MATCAVGPLAGVGLFQSDGGKRERARTTEREGERERRDRCEPEGDGAIVKKPRDKCKIDSHWGCLLKCNRWLLTAGEKNLPHLFLKKRHSRVLAFRIIWLIYFVLQQWKKTSERNFQAQSWWGLWNIRRIPAVRSALEKQIKLGDFLKLNSKILDEFDFNCGWELRALVGLSLAAKQHKRPSLLLKQKSIPFFWFCKYAGQIV